MSAVPLLRDLALAAVGALFTAAALSFGVWRDVVPAEEWRRRLAAGWLGEFGAQHLVYAADTVCPLLTEAIGSDKFLKSERTEQIKTKIFSTFSLGVIVPVRTEKQFSDIFSTVRIDKRPAKVRKCSHELNELFTSLP